MSSITIRIPTPLRPLTGGESQPRVEGSTVREALTALESRHEGIRGRVLTPEGELRGFVNVFVGETDIRRLQGLDTALAEGSTLSVLPAVAGGSQARRRRLAALRSEIEEIAPAEVASRLAAGALLVDVREPDEVAQGSPAQAVKIPRGFLEIRIEEFASEPDREILALCAGGTRSLFAADDLRRLGFERVVSVAGGFSAWKKDGLPFEVPRALSPEQRERYGRHLTVPEVGEEGQLRLLDAKVLLVGAGGLGAPAALYLAAAGVGTLGIIDDDVVDRSNLQRQILHADDRVGTPKVESARDHLLALNPTLEVRVWPERLTAANALEIFAGFDVVLDGTDNFATRYLVNDACVRLGIPNVHGSVFRFEGQVSVFWPGRTDGEPGPCYRCLYPEPPPPELAPSCAEAGVLGVLPGVVGLLQAVETLKLLLGIGEPLVGRLLHYDALTAELRRFESSRDPECAWCGEDAETVELNDVAFVCATGS